MVIKGNKNNIKKYLIKNKNEINIIDCKLGGETMVNNLSNEIEEKDTELRVNSKEISEHHSELSLKIFKAFGI